MGSDCKAIVKLTLDVGEDSLVVEAEGGDWARCHLLSSQGAVYLGANVTKYVLDGLEFAVDESNKIFLDDAQLRDIFGYRLRQDW